MELAFDRMYTVTSRLSFTVAREDDGVPVVCIVDHPAVRDFQAQKLLEVQCEYLLQQSLHSSACPSPHPFILFSLPDKPEVKILVGFPQGLTREGENLELSCRAKGKPQYGTHT